MSDEERHADGTGDISETGRDAGPSGDRSAGSSPPGAEVPPGSGAIPPGGPPGGPHRPGLPWEARESGDGPGAALATLRVVLLSPGTAFRRMRQRSGLGDAILFLLIFGTIGAFFGMLWQSWMRAVLGTTFGADLGEIAAMNTGAVFMLLFAPVFVLVTSAIYAGVAHVMLLLFGGAPQPLETTWKVMCYGLGATGLFSIVPLCGGLIGFFWGLVVTIVGLREAQEVPGARAAGAVLVPIVLVCACLAVGMLAIVSMGMAIAGLG